MENNNEANDYETEITHTLYSYFIANLDNFFTVISTEH